MPMPKSPFRAGLLCGVAALFSGAAFAADKPATPEGAKTIADAFASLAGRSGAEALTVAPSGTHYAVTFDIAAMNAAIAPSGTTYDPALLKLDVYAQDDGAWRIEQEQLPPLSGHVKQPEQAGGGTIDFSVRVDNAHFTLVYDPSLRWARSGHGSQDKGVVDIKGPGLKETFGFGALNAELSTKVVADGQVASTLDETIGSLDLVMDVDPKAANPKAPAAAQPVHVAVKAQGAKISLRADDLQPRPLLDLWSFYIAHPKRSDLASNQDQLKTLLTGALADQLSIAETASVDKIAIETPKGPVTLDGASVEVGAANKGAASGFSERFAARGLTLPPDLVPDLYKTFIPGSFDIGFKATGFDLAAAGAEWIADLHLEGDAPPVSKIDAGKAAAKLIGGGPISVELTPTRIEAPRLNLGADGKVAIEQSHPTGKITLKAHDFDKTVAALQALGPDVQAKLTPVIAMAKGLAKTDSDGVMTWVGELGADKVLKVNGLPLGKSPL